MAKTVAETATGTLWQPQPAPWAWLQDRVEMACQANPFLAMLRQRMLDETGTRLIDWIDHLAIPATEVGDARLSELGFVEESSRDTWLHPAGMFPPVRRPAPNEGFPWSGTGLKVEQVDAFLEAHGLRATVGGSASSSLRFAPVAPHPVHAVAVVERHGNTSWSCAEPTTEQHAMAAMAGELFAARPRPLTNARAGFEAAEERFERVAAVLGRSWACDLFFASERDYWLRRNRAARIQLARQDRLGLGWANHDHHTYRCSREFFAPLIAVLERMGFVCRERFYAGAEAGWGAQVLEHPECGLVVFADVDLSPGEVSGDFAHQGLSPLAELGTVGIWCKLHGEAFLHAGLHHLECQFQFDAARTQLADAGIPTMAPFTDFPFLRQAFTEGETWQVSEQHLQELVEARWITASQAAEFAAHGARGSHLEILERNDGYKGFNQTGISQIIAQTDPRRG